MVFMRLVLSLSMQVVLDQLTYGPLNNIANLMFFSLLVESAVLLIHMCAHAEAHA